MTTPPEQASTDPTADERSVWPPVRRLGERGRYHLEERLASGGAATVWRAYDDHLDRSVAVKILHPHLVDDDEMVSRFERESRNAARIHHPNAIRIFDSDRVNDVVFLVMEYVDGPTLKALLDLHGALPDWRTVAAIGEQMAAALGEAHRQGLIHRDVKPANILFTSDGVVKVVDFGIAKALSASSHTLTAAGTTVGTAAYIAPEQYAGADVDQRADIYALGMVLHECLSGRPAYDGDTPTATAAARLTRDVVPPRQLRSDVDRRLDDLIVQCTRRERADRYGDAEALARAFRDLRKGDDDARTVTRELVHRPAPEVPARVALPEVDPDAPTDPGMATPASGGRRRLVLAFGAGMALAVVAFLVLRDDPAPVNPDDIGPLAEIVTAKDFDPEGDGAERPGDVALAFDKVLSSGWSTETYRASSRFNDRKTGVGLWFDLGSATEVSALGLDLAEGGVELEVYLADELPGEEDGILGWGLPTVGRQLLDDASTKLLLDEPLTARYWLLWITNLPEVEDGRFRATVNEVRFELPVPEP